VLPSLNCYEARTSKHLLPCITTKWKEIQTFRMTCQRVVMKRQIRGLGPKSGDGHGRRNQIDAEK